MDGMLDVVVMAAGKGTRMKSARPKVLHRLAGRPMLRHVLDTVASLDARAVVVVTGHGAEQVEAASTPDALAGKLGFVRQEPQRGTGDAVRFAAPSLRADGTVLILNGDVPLIAADTLRALAAAARPDALALLTIELDDPTGYGRIVRDGAGLVQAIVEQKDASEAQRAIRETYTGVMAVPGARLGGWLARLSDDNAQKEFYLTDLVAMAVADGVAVQAVRTRDAVEVAGVNSPLQLSQLERAYQRRQAEAQLEAGVRLADPARFDLRGRLHCAADVEIDVGCIFEGVVELGEGVRIGAHCVIADARIAAGTVVHPFSHIQGEKAGVEVGGNARIGPFARLRPGARLGDEVHVGNFVEVKNSTLAAGAKANHLAYLGDSTVGERVNFGAGSITANYDGVNKHRTTIGDDASIGSNCVLIAPVTIGAGGTVGGGSTVSRDTPPGTLTVARARQVSLERWKKPTKKAAE
ncbi:bifunctional UDP-N-acetylglucosamine diphosphorylase/glucosamine-1-phosphate N-acetyltransferase GlmU [Xylophilus sp. GOD-11R]|uniref:bifunctional UDP-N-acetylglucosamine diphosphorylase/glucosamine-1-phosphate N-acetyltransferase GlmU n=1 Tax=Xylophilus sp. GOD-11R TaxID=3089814 RepID=UPI00298D1DAD|nr:bifunctional UDP-N-acetylglucosamine diphosphorylase/glucosamine-1-phosphate N-acetyltransferase GlmU [Xylophilus sp. GOD-11R]WPB59508.1 bifunctional UDP-N-acetylglucosamine diphosphorylase/glucosamine-1-phosphate N-acetyltransferase GlmU [Xylophilus sp. GOD-11R]